MRFLSKLALAVFFGAIALRKGSGLALPHLPTKIGAPLPRACTLQARIARFLIHASAAGRDAKSRQR